MIQLPPVPPNKLPWQRALVNLSMVATSAFVLAILYFAQPVCIPLAMGIFFAFVLDPLVNFLERRGLGRTPAVLLVVGGALLIFLTTSAVIAQQVTSLGNTIGEKSENVKLKIADAKRRLSGDGDSKIGKMVSEIENSVMGKQPDKSSNPVTTADGAVTSQQSGGGVSGVGGFAPAAAVTPKTGDKDRPVSVVIEPSRPAWFSQLNFIIGPATEAFGLAAFSFVLVVFILLAKDDLRDRLLRLVGGGQMTTATRAANDASTRISRYLLMQLLVNGTFGIIVTIGLFLAGIEYSLLWGFIGFLMRYVPYIGTWIGVLPPLIYTAATSDGWFQPLFVLGIFGSLELFSNNAVEPKLYGKSLGASEVALLLSAAFWSFLWGPIGLILSGPITTCLLVMGKYTPSLSFFHILLGTEPPLSPGMLLYQRFVGGDEDDATRLIEEALKEKPPMKYFDEALLPAFLAVRQAKELGELDPETEARVLATAETALEGNLGELDTDITPGNARLLGCSARDELDAFTVAALVRTLSLDRWDSKIVSPNALASELADAVAAFDPHVVLIGSLPPGGVAQTRYMVKRLRARFPKVKILVGRWTEKADEPVSELRTSGADAVESTLEGALSTINGWQAVVASSADTPALPKQSAGDKAAKPLHVGTANAK
jgi:predicted PurR-regulated permease PerM